MGQKDSGKISKKSGGLSGKDKAKEKAKDKGKGKGKAKSYQPVEDQQEVEEDIYESSPSKPSAVGGAGEWTQTQLPVIGETGDDNEDINLDSSQFSPLDPEAPQTDWGYGGDQTAAAVPLEGAYAPSSYSQGKTENAFTYPTRFNQEPMYAYSENQVSRADALTNNFENMSMTSGDQGYQYASPDQLAAASNQSSYMPMSQPAITYGTGNPRVYAGITKSRQQVPRINKAVSISGNTNLNYQKPAHLNRNNQKIMGGHAFKVHHSKKFVVGHVLKTVWFEPRGSTSRGAEGGTIIDGLPGKVRRFVIVQNFVGHSMGVPINTYGYQGTLKPGCHAEHHAMIYTGNEPGYLPGEAELVNPKIRMFPSTAEGLHHSSRLNYAKRYTIEHNLNVMFIGRIDDTSSSDFWMTLNVINGTAPAQVAPPDDDDEDDDDPGMPTVTGPTRPAGPSGPSTGASGSRQESSSSRQGSRRDSRNQRYTR